MLGVNILDYENRTTIFKWREQCLKISLKCRNRYARVVDNNQKQKSHRFYRIKFVEIAKWNFGSDPILDKLKQKLFLLAQIDLWTSLTSKCIYHNILLQYVLFASNFFKSSLEYDTMSFKNISKNVFLKIKTSFARLLSLSGVSNRTDILFEHRKYLQSIARAFNRFLNRTCCKPCTETCSSTISPIHHIISVHLFIENSKQYQRTNAYTQQKGSQVV